MPTILELFRVSVVAVHKDRFKESLELRGKLERDLQEKRDQKWKLNEAFVYRKAISEDDYRQMKEALQQDILTLEMKVNEARQEEIEIEELLDFSETLLLNAAGVRRGFLVRVLHRYQVSRIALAGEHEPQIAAAPLRVFRSLGHTVSHEAGHCEFVHAAFGAEFIEPQ